MKKIQPIKKPKEPGAASSSDRNRPPILTCKVCLLKFRGQSELDKCMKRHEQIFNLKADCICPVCGVTVPKMELTDHFKNEHKEMGKTCCLDCLAVVNNKTGTELRKHFMALRPSPLS